MLGSCGKPSVHCVPMLDRSTPNSSGPPAIALSAAAAPVDAAISSELQSQRRERFSRRGASIGPDNDSTRQSR
jgi:hypothetical protein